MTSCISDIAGSIALDCTAKITNGFTGRAVLIPTSLGATITADSSNPRIITAVALTTGQKTVGIDNRGADPFSGSSIVGNIDSGRVKYQKTLAIRIPLRGAEASKDVIEPLVSDPRGFLAIVELKDKNHPFAVYGLEAPMVADAASFNQNETDNGGDALVNLVCSETYENAELWDDDYATSLAEFERLLGLAY